MGLAMKDYLAQVEKLRKDAAECALIRDLATDKAKRKMSDRLASHLNLLELKTGTGKYGRPRPVNVASRAWRPI
jgi:hypothetical protein